MRIGAPPLSSHGSRRGAFLRPHRPSRMLPAIAVTRGSEACRATVTFGMIVALGVLLLLASLTGTSPAGAQTETTSPQTQQPQQTQQPEQSPTTQQTDLDTGEPVSTDAPGVDPTTVPIRTGPIDDDGPDRLVLIGLIAIAVVVAVVVLWFASDHVRRLRRGDDSGSPPPPSRPTR
jgi:hypothetical protein